MRYAFCVFFLVVIAGISGKIREIGTNSCLVESGNFVLKVLCPVPTLTSFRPGESVFLHTFLSVREDGWSLFGFSESAEKDLFEKLISVSGIGPKTALEILAAGFSAVQNALSAGDADFLSGIKGIGKKTAARAIVELREKVSEISGVLPPKKSHLQDAEKVLQNLGFSPKEISERFKGVPEDFDSAEKAVEWFLRQK